MFVILNALIPGPDPVSFQRLSFWKIGLLKVSIFAPSVCSRLEDTHTHMHTDMHTHTHTLTHTHGHTGTHTHMHTCTHTHTHAHTLFACP